MSNQSPNSYTQSEYRENLSRLAEALDKYGEHLSDCNSHLDTHTAHRGAMDTRAVCTAWPCSCGLIDALTSINPHIRYTFPGSDGEWPDNNYVIQAERAARGMQVIVNMDKFRAPKTD